MRTFTVCLLLACLLTSSGCVGCAPPEHLAVAHRHSPDAEARIVVLPVSLPPNLPNADAEGRTFARLYATELLRSYEVMDYDRLLAELEGPPADPDSLLEDEYLEAVAEHGVDGILRAQVYQWQPGTPGFWFLAKPGQIGFQAQLVDVRTGSVLWSVNRVRETRPSDALSVGLATVFEDLAAEMPRRLTTF